MDALLVMPASLSLGAPESYQELSLSSELSKRPKVVAILDFAISAAARIDCRQAPTHLHNDSSIT